MKSQFLIVLCLYLGIHTLFSQNKINIIANGKDRDTLYVCRGELINLQAGRINEVFDFNTNALPYGWTSTGINFSNPCPFPVDGTTYLWMSPPSYPYREITTNGFPINSYCSIYFDMVYAFSGQSTPCEGPEYPDEGVHLQYSIDGGSNWVDMHYWPPNDPNCPGPGGYDQCMTTWNNYCEVIPVTAYSSNTLFRWYQEHNSANYFDAWGIDNIVISDSNCDSVYWSNGIIGDTISPFILNNDTLFIATCINDPSNCDTIWIKIINSPNVNIIGLDSVYYTDSNDDTLIGSPAGGYFQGNGMVADVFSPSLAGVGTHIISYLSPVVHTYSDPGLITVWMDDFSTDQGWSGYDPGNHVGGWERGAATSSAGCQGRQDPDTDISPSADNYIIGTSIGDCYQNVLATQYWLTSPTINCSGYTNCQIQFFSHTGVEDNSKDNIAIQVFNGVSWIDIWYNTSIMDEYNWTQWQFDVSSIADNNPNFQVRFGIGPTDFYSNFRGWNIDDFRVLADGILTYTDTCDVIAYDTTIVLNSVSNEIKSGSSIRIYPNPTKDQLNIESGIDIEQVQIVNHLGEVLVTKPVQAKKLQLPLALKAGLYIVLIETKFGIYRNKLVVAGSN